MKSRKPKFKVQTVRFPFVKWEDAIARGLNPGALRLFVAAWSQAAPKGFIPQELPAKICERFGDGFDAEIESLDTLFAELSRLGFVKNVKKTDDCFVFEPSGGWLS